MKVLLIHEYFNIVSQNLVPYLSKILGKNFHWTGRKYYRKDFLPIEDIEKLSYRQEQHALYDLNKGYYDFVIFSEGTQLLYLSSYLPLKGTKRVILDCNDKCRFPRYYWENSEIYLKAQYSSKNIIIANSDDKEPYNIKEEEFKKVFPFSLTPSFKVYKNKLINSPERKNYDVFFSGSAWPKKRVELINIIKSHKEIHFVGGLFNRGDLNFNCVFPDKLITKKISSIDHIHSLRSSEICLNMIGNGNNCFRQFEILYLGELLLTQRHDSQWGIKNPKNQKHCIFFNPNGEDLIDLIKEALNNKEKLKKIKQNGKKFFEKNYHPKVLAKNLIDILSNFM